MKIVFQANQLAKVLKDVTRIIPASAKTNTHRFVRIQADRDDCRVEFETTSHEAAMRRTLYDELVQSPAKISESGSCLLPARDLLEIVKHAKDTVSMETGGLNGTSVILQFDNAKFEMQGLEPDLFTPYKNSASSISCISVNALQLKNLLEHTTYACSTTETRPILTGVNFQIVEGKINAVASDGLRLSQMTVEAKNAEGAQGNLTIPKATLESLAAILPHDDDEVVELEFGDAGLVATWADDSTRCVMRAIDGTFPDVTRIVPRVMRTNLRVNRNELLTSFERIEIIAGENENKMMHVEFRPTDLLLTASSSTAGSAADIVNLVEPISDEVEPMLFNIRYWLDVLKSFNTEDEVIVGINGQNQPITVRPANADYLALLSPIMYTASVQLAKSA